MVRATPTGNLLMPAEKKPDPRLAKMRLDASANARIEFVCEPEVLLRIDDHAKALGLGRSAYIRMCLFKQMEKEDRERKSAD